MSGWILALIATVYVACLFLAAWFGDYRGASFRKRWQSFIYCLSLAVYCTSWTFFGAVGQASENLWSFIPIYLGPILVFVFFWKLLVKLITVSKQENITSIADFIASRHGRSHFMAILVTLILVIGVLPYIALQLKAIVMGFAQLTDDSLGPGRWSREDLALAITLTLSVFVIMFGTRKLDATEHQNGIMTAIAFESLVKLSVFLLVGSWVSWAAVDHIHLDDIIEPGGEHAFSWFDSIFMPTVMAMTAILCLPRQFHVTVVENSSIDDFYKARWLFPAYLSLLALFVVPLALIGNQLLGSDVPGDAYLIELPKLMGNLPIAVLAFLGGVSAAISMVIVATLALTTMVSNEILMPLLLRRNNHSDRDSNDFYRFSGLLLTVRRTTIVILLMMSWVVYRLLEGSGSLASIGQMSFSAVAQLAPVLLGSLYIRESNAKAAAGGLLVGFMVWLFCLVVPVLVDVSWLGSNVVHYGVFGQQWLKPDNLFGLGVTGTVTGATLVALSLNTLIYLCGCLYLRPGIEERRQSRKFVDAVLSEDGVFPDAAITVGELEQLASRFVSKNRVLGVIQSFEYGDKVLLFGALNGGNKQAEPELVAAIERLLAGTLGASSARIVMKSLVHGNVGLEEVQAMVDEASEVFQFNRELLQGAIEHISMGVSVVDRNLELVAWNQQYLQLFDYPNGLIKVGRPIADMIRHNALKGLCGPGDVDHHVNKRLSYMRNGTAHRSERRRQDGRVIQIQGNPMPGGGFVMAFTDITGFRQVEQALKEVNESLEHRVQERTKELSLLNVQLLGAKSQAEKANHLRSRFFAAISHDLMQPMNAARLFTASMELEAKGTVHEELAQNISNSLRSAEHLLTDLLDMSRIEAGKVAVNLRDMPVMQVLDPLKSEFSLLSKEGGLIFRVASSNTWIKTDPVLLRRILQNFLTNTLRYVENAGRTGKVLLGCRFIKNQQLRIEVRDNGQGIPQDKQALIFAEFERLSTAVNGLGLGLSIAKGIAQILDAKISVSSSPGQGAIFSVVVPLVARNIVDKRVVSDSPDIGDIVDMGLNVLCIDDEADIIKGMTGLLTRWGCRVASARNYCEAIQAIAGMKPDLLMVDYQIGDQINGIELIKRIRESLGYQTGAVLVTANQQDDLRQQCQELNISYLRKPVKPAAMRAILNRYEAEKLKTETV